MARGTKIEQSGYEFGFETGKTQFITEQQFVWLSHRMGCEDDLEPCKIMQLDPNIIADWLTQPDFSVVYEKVLGNKREGFKYLATQLLPKGLRVLNDLLDSSSVNAQVRGLQMLLRTNGLLIDKVQKVDSDAVNRLMESLRQMRPIISVEPKPKALPAPAPEE